MKNSALILFCLSCHLYASTERIMTYNLLNFWVMTRQAEFITIIQYTEPDIIVAQEVVGQTGYSRFKTNVLDISTLTNGQRLHLLIRVLSRILRCIISMKISLLLLLLQYTAQSGDKETSLSGIWFKSSGVPFKVLWCPP